MEKSPADQAAGLHEPFDAPRSTDEREGPGDGQASPPAHPAREAASGSDETYSTREPEQLRRWTGATVALALVAALSFGSLSVATGSTLAAFAAGLLVGLGTLFAGVGEMVGVLVAAR